jgi:transposase
MKHIISRITSFFDITILPNTTSNNFRKGIKNIYKEFRDIGFANLLEIIQYKSNLVKVEESYTSKLCLNCLNTNDIGAAESYTCMKCPEDKRVEVDRDESASRAIYYRTVHRFSL